MGLFDKFKKGNEKRNALPKGTGSLGYADPKEEAFWKIYVESLQAKDRGALKTAMEKREQALNTASPDQGFKGMAQHNIAILAMYHLGQGQRAAKAARDSLECGDEYYRFSESHKEELRFGAHLESLQTAMMTASTYDEALQYCQQGAKLYGSIFTTKLQEIEEVRKEYPRYADYQRMTSLLYYSRVSPEQDQGDYAPAMSLLQLLLDRSEEPAYDLSYEEFVDILDDYGTITIMYLMKKARMCNVDQDTFRRELAFIADEPLKRIADFLPDCEPADRPRLDNIIKAFRMLPGVAERDAYAPFR